MNIPKQKTYDGVKYYFDCKVKKNMWRYKSKSGFIINFDDFALGLIKEIEKPIFNLKYEEYKGRRKHGKQRIS